MKQSGILVILMTLLFTGCGGVLPWDYYYAESFVAFYVTEEPYVSQSKEGLPSIDILWDWNGECYGYNSKGDDKAQYEALCAKHNDVGYNRKTAKPEAVTHDPYGRSAYWKDFVAIDVVSDRDFDAEHPAGTSLRDVLQYYCRSYWPYVNGGYNYNYYGDTCTYEDAIIYGREIRDLPEDGLRLVSSLEIYFPYVPEMAVGQHNITVSLTADDGTLFVLNASIVLDFYQEFYPHGKPL